VTGQLGRFLLLSGRDQEAAPQLERALALAETLHLPETLVQAMSSKAALLAMQDRLFEARALLEAALELALTHNLHAAALRAYNNLVANMFFADLFADVYAVEERALEHARRVGDRFWEARFLTGNGPFWLGRWDEALAWEAEAKQLAPEVARQGVDFVSVRIHCERGELAKAREVFSQATAAAESEDAQTAAFYAFTEAWLLRAEGKLVEAQAAAERALAVAQEFGVKSIHFKLGLQQALETALERGDTTRAGELLATLAPLEPGQRTPLLRAMQAEFQARLGALLGDSDVEAQFTAAEALYGDLQTPFFEARVELHHAEWLIAQGRADQAHPLLTTAHDTFQRLQAKPLLERLAAAEASTPAETSA
jgi:tetratricopeptide (TPR) repeat protein